MSVNAWVADLALRADQLKSLGDIARSGLTGLRTARVWIGGLFSPEAYITATRQAVAQENKWALESLQLELEVGRCRMAVSIARELVCNVFSVFVGCVK